MDQESGLTGDDRDIAVIGTSLRLPGARTPEEFWDHLAAGRSLISEVPARRWRKEDHLGHPRREFNKTNSVWGGFVEDIDCFDADFFQVSPREAQSMDPQQRMALELSWHALEDAGYRADRLAGSRTGVFMGVCHWDYAELIEQEVEEVDAYYPTGAAYAIIANRVSHHFDFRGPSVVNDTACASSLVAVQQAVQALLAGDCEYALAGGVNLTWSPRHFIAFAKAGMLSPDGVCRAFDTDANGYVRGEGAGVLMLKRAADARRDGDAVHAVIKGIGSNHGGRTSSLTVTNPAAQAELITGVYRRAGVEPSTVTYVEAHGTGTPVGDPIELRGLKQVFGAGADQRCGVGSVKTNIGHLEGAAGVAGMLKVILAMRHRKLPGTVNFRELNSLVKLDGSPLYVVDRLTDWENDGSAPLRAGVSSFGFGGTNAHVLLEAGTPVAATEDDDSEQWLPVSAKDETRLREMCAGLALWVRARIASGEPLSLVDVARTLREGRVPMRERVVFRAADLESWATQLETVATEEKLPKEILRGRAGDGTPDGLDAEDLAELGARWIAQERWDKFAAAWAKGLPVDWAQWPETGRRTHVPGYAFARTPHWFTPSRKSLAAKTIAGPLGEPTAADGGWSFPLRFDDTQGFVRDHVVNGTRIVPGVVALEVVTAAARHTAVAGERGPKSPRVRNAVWIRPLLVGGTELTARLTLTPSADGYDYAIVDDQGTPYTSGRVEYAETSTETTDLDALRERHPHRVDVAEGYAALRASGIEHGPALRGLHTLHSGPEGVLAELELPAEATSGPLLQPAILDSALLAALALGGDGGWRTPSAPAVPFAVDEFTAHTATTRTTWAWLRPGKNASKMDVDLYDDRGGLCARFTGYTARSLAVSEKTPAPEGDLIEVTDVWTESPATADSATAVTVLNAALSPDLADASAARLGLDVLPLTVPAGFSDAAALKNAFEACFTHVQKLATGTRRVLVVAPGEPDSPVYAPLAALLKTAHLENPGFAGKIVFVGGFDPRDTERFESIVRAEASSDDVEVAYDADGRRLRRETVELPEGSGGESLLRDGGVYWITGGAGGLGQLLAERLCGSHRATVVLSGRSEHSPAVEVLRSKLRTGQVVYRQVDVTDSAAVHAAVEAIRADHGRLDGVFHAAGVLDDAYLATKTLASTTAVLAPKVDGTVHLDAATRVHGLDFLLLFSSVAAAFGGAAQADYAVANAFLDAFATRRQASGALTRSIAWPLWADGGMQVDEASLAYMRKRTGTVPLPGDTGLDALERALRTDAPVRRVVLFGETPKLRVHAGLDRPATAAAPKKAATTVSLSEAELATRTQDHLRELFAAVTRQDAEQIFVDEKLEQYGIDSIAIVDLTSRLEDDFGSLPKTLFFEYVDLRGVAEYFLAEHHDRLVELFTPEQTPVEEPVVEAPVVVAPPVVPAPAVTKARPVQPSADARHDIAVVGMAGRYPGADTLEEFWELLSDGRHSFEPVPASRWPHEDIYFDERDVQGKTTVKTGTFLRDVDAFDPRYFNISQRDAELLAPEVRLFLQAGVTAMEDAGYSRETLSRRYDGDVGVLIGSMNNSYSLYGFQNMLMRGTATSGSEIGVMANMLSYFYGFTGPSVFVDTMCSSSSACVHQAVRMLREGECRMVVVGGINLMLHPFDLISTSQAHFTTKTADVVRSYGLGADGTILGEGVGALVFKPLEDAVADGDHVYGVIKGSGMTNAGVRNGFTVPSPKQQSRAIEKALDDSGVDARTISYLEGHGSATSLGDPIEIKGASLAFARDTADLGFCALGSVKSNVAHLLSGSGLVGLTKVLLQLKHRTLAPSLHSETLSPAIDFEKTPFVVQRERDEWRRPVIGGEETPLRAGITSIGAGGVNVHIVVEEHPGAVVAAPDSGQPRLLVFSAMTPKALNTVLGDMRDYVRTEPTTLDAFAHALQTGKNELPCRLAFVANDLADARTRLATLSEVDWTAEAPSVPADVRFTASTLRQRRTVDAATVELALREGKLPDLAGYWASGATLDWDVLWTTRPAKLSLPAYPFDKVRCWYPEYDDAPSVLRPLAFTRREHPWVGLNRSDLTGVRYAVELRGDDLLDYVCTVGRKRRYVTLALLDAALAFARLAGVDGPLRVSDARWGELPLPGDAPETLEWRLGGSGGTHRAELWHTGDGTIRFAADLGVAAAEAASMPEPLREAVTVDRAGFYAKLAEAGVDALPYGQSVEGVTELGGQRLLVRVAEPAMCQDRHKRQVHVPAWVLSALAQGVAYTRGEFVTAARVGSLSGQDFDRTRAIVLDGATATFLDEQGRVLGRIGDAEFTSAPLPRLSGGQSGQTRVALSSVSQLETVVPHQIAPVAETSGTALVESLRETVADLLKFDLAEIDVDTHFNAYGFESIALAQLSSELNKSLGSDLTPAVFFECPNIRTLAEHLGERYGSELTTPEPVTPRQIPVVEEQDDAVAIIGIAGKFPGADDVDTFWQRLREGANLITEYPGDRFDGPYAETVRQADFPKFAGLVDDVDRFDADFFSLSRLEAELMDPQHRLALETVWAALENGGYAPARLPENTGVYFGVSGSDYHHLLNASGVAPDGYTATGNAHSMLANRISFVLDVHGPSEPIDTACSSSLIALGRAVDSIRSGRCDMAVAGGVNLLLSVDTFAATQMSGMLSPDGRCKTFSADADGYVRSEGAAVVLLKPLAQAQRDGDAIWGVVRGIAENHGGRAGSLTAPNGKAQAAVIQEAMRGIDPDTVGYVEAHGTGTGLGDPVEVNALASAYSALRPAGARPRPCALGSVKTNIGHLESAAGLAGVLKVLLAMRHGELPATLHCERLNPQLRLADGGFEVVRELRSWAPRADGLPLRAGVSSFGFGGANAHVVLEAPPATVSVPATGPQAVVLSARDADRLRASAGRLREFLTLARREGRDPELADLAFTLQIGREAMEQRLGFVATSVDDVIGVLGRFLAGDRSEDWHTGGTRRSRGTGVRRDAEQPPEVTRALTEGRLDTVTALWCDGLFVDWRAAHATGERHVVRLPGYPFARERYWVPTAAVPQPVAIAEPEFDTEAYAALLDAVLDDRVSGT